MAGEQDLDRDMINELVEVMGSEFRTLVNSFVSDGERRMALLAEAISEGHAERVREVAHGFKGSSSNLGARELAELCLQLERQGRQEALQQAPDTLEKAREAFERARRELNDFLAGGQ